MSLLEHNGFKFKNILSKGYNLKEDEAEVLSSITMSDGSIRKNYGKMPKTTITVKFGQLNKQTYKEYISHFSKNEDYYTYYSFKYDKMITKKFFVSLPDTSMISSVGDGRIDEFDVTLSQIGGEINQ